MSVAGFVHSHSGLAYLIFFAALLNLFLGLTAMTAKQPSFVSAPLKWSHSIVLWGGRLNVLIGAAYWSYGGWMSASVSSQWWIILSVLLWGPIEVTSKRFVGPEVEHLASGGKPSKKLTVGVGIQLLCISAIFGIMSAKSYHG